MKLPIWYKAKNGKWVVLTHFEDGRVGLTMQEAVEKGLVKGLGHGMGHLDKNKFNFVGYIPHGTRFLLKKEIK